MQIGRYRRHASNSLVYTYNFGRFRFFVCHPPLIQLAEIFSCTLTTCGNFSFSNITNLDFLFANITNLDFLSNSYICDLVQASEEQRPAAQKEGGELRQQIREIDRARIDARRELQESRRQAKMLEIERAKIGKDAEELAIRLTKAEENNDAVRSSL